MANQFSPQFKRGQERLIKILSPQQRLKFQQAGIIKGTQGIEKIGGSEFFKVPSPDVLQQISKGGFIDPRAALQEFPKVDKETVSTVPPAVGRTQQPVVKPPSSTRSKAPVSTVPPAVGGLQQPAHVKPPKADKAPVSTVPPAVGGLQQPSPTPKAQAEFKQFLEKGRGEIKTEVKNEMENKALKDELKITKDQLKQVGQEKDEQAAQASQAASEQRRVAFENQIISLENQITSMREDARVALQEQLSAISGELQTQEAETQEARQVLTSTLAITPQEQEIQQKFDNLISSGALGISEVSDQPIARKFITGQAQAIQRQTLAEAEPLERQLARLQTQRQAALDVAKLELEFEEADEAQLRGEQKRLKQTQEKQKDEAIESAEKQLSQITKLQAEKEIAAAKMELDLLQFATEEERKQRQQEIDLVKALVNVPEGAVVSVGGQEFIGLKPEEIDPFFTGANIISFMKSIPEGETSSITDPNTGETFELQGLKDVTPNLKTIQSTDDAGRVTLTTYATDPQTGETKTVSQVSAGSVGKSKTQPSNLSVNFPRQTQNALFDANGQQIGFAIFNPITAQTQFTDFNGNPIEFPTGGRIGSVSSKFSESEDEGSLSSDSLAD